MAYRRGPMPAGERDYLIRIESRPVTDAVDDVGAPMDSWTTLVAQMPASRMDISARERLSSDQLSARYDTRWEINYRSDMDPDLIDVPKLRRVVCFDRTHDITAASVIGRRVGIELLTLASTR